MSLLRHHENGYNTKKGWEQFFKNTLEFYGNLKISVKEEKVSRNRFWKGFLQTFKKTTIHTLHFNFLLGICQNPFGSIRQYVNTLSAPSYPSVNTLSAPLSSSNFWGFANLLCFNPFGQQYNMQLPSTLFGLSPYIFSWKRMIWKNSLYFLKKAFLIFRKRNFLERYISGKVYLEPQHIQNTVKRLWWIVLQKSSYLVHSLIQARKNKKIYPEKNFLYFEKFLL